MRWSDVMELFLGLRAHCRKDVQQASQRSGLATAVMKYRSLRSKVVRR